MRTEKIKIKNTKVISGDSIVAANENIKNQPFKIQRSLAATLMLPLLTPYQRRHHGVAADEGSSAATFCRRY
jgi:hypothetical protein